MKRYWISAPSDYGDGWMTVRVECTSEGIVKETHTGWPWARGMSIKSLVEKLRRQHGDYVGRGPLKVRVARI